MMLRTIFKCSPDARSLAARQLVGYASVAQRAAGVSRLVPSCACFFLRPEDFLTVGESDPHPLADRVRVFAREERERRPGRTQCADPSGFPAVPSPCGLCVGNGSVKRCHPRCSFYVAITAPACSRPPRSPVWRGWRHPFRSSAVSGRCASPACASSVPNCSPRPPATASPAIPAAGPRGKDSARSRSPSR